MSTPTKTELRTLILDHIEEYGAIKALERNKVNLMFNVEEDLADKLLTLLEDTVLEVIGKEPAPHEDYGGGGRALHSKQLVRLVELKEGRASSRPSAAKPSQDSEVK